MAEDDVPRVVSVISSILDRLAKHNDVAAAGSRLPLSAGAKSAPPDERAASAFDGLTKPSISVRGYLKRIFQYANCSLSCYVVAFIHFNRFVQRHNAVLVVDSINVHRLLITSVLSAVKFMDDVHYNNAFFAKLGGISLKEMNYMEAEFLFGVGFELNVSPDTFTSYCSMLQGQMCLESPPAAPPRLHCHLSEEESGLCQQTQRLAI